MRDLGAPKYYRGIEVASYVKAWTVCQTISAPVGRLIYLAHTRPYIAYVVSVVSQFMHSPNVSHRNVVDRILRYFK
ncbi:hypothetical protein Prudu_002421 [Prunus dulcis]|uniref:Transposable element protein n=1 Tax=Prunus dulcis TaxID=3755 RepID=A0A4Y1QQW6_PRUDU|nr:hypothetical protein Prudu_002421 [Prunus dulcis]